MARGAREAEAGKQGGWQPRKDWHGKATAASNLWELARVTAFEVAVVPNHKSPTFTSPCFLPSRMHPAATPGTCLAALAPPAGCARCRAAAPP